MNGECGIVGGVTETSDLEPACPASLIRLFGLSCLFG
jgi:hypothetical protein